MSEALIKEFDKVFDQLFGVNNKYPGHVPYHLEKGENEYVIELPLVGMSKNDIKVTVVNDVLKVVAKQNASRFSRNYENSWLLLDDQDSENVNASMENGVLTIKVGRKKPAKKVIDITVV